MDAAARQAWLTERRTGIGSSDAAAVLGLSKWATEIDVWLSKRGEREDDRDTPAMWFGRALEDVVARRYSEVTGLKLVRAEDAFPPHGIARHPDLPFLIATPDRLVENRDDFGVEVKTANAFTSHEWGPEGTDEIPQAYVVQCLHCMMVLGANQWDVAALIGGSTFRRYTIHRDAELEAVIAERCAEWWQRHIVEGVEPAVDGSESARKWLASRYPVERGELFTADGEIEEWATKLAQARSAVDEWDERKVEAENRLKALIGDRPGCSGAFGSITWKSVKGRRDMDWQGLAATLGAKLVEAGAIDRATLMLVEKEHVRQGSGYRRFTFRPRNGREQ